MPNQQQIAQRGSSGQLIKPESMSPLQQLRSTREMLQEVKELVDLLPENSPLRTGLAEAAAICFSPTIPQHARGNPLMVATLKVKADAIGVPFTTALDWFYPTPGGKIGMESKGMRAILTKQGCKYEFKYFSKGKQVDSGTPGIDEVRFLLRRPIGDKDDDEWQEYEAIWSEGRAKAYKCWIKGRDGEKGHWGSLWDKWMKGGQEPPNMYGERATAEAARKIAADLLGGMTYTPEEAQIIDVTPYDAESISDAAGTAESKLIDEAKILPEDEQRFRKTCEIYDIGPKAQTAKLLEIQQVAEDQTPPDQYVSDNSRELISREIARLKNEFHDKEEEKKAKRRGRRKSATEQAQTSEAPTQTVNGKALAEAQQEPPPEEDLGVSQDDAPPAEPTQGSLGGEW